MYLVLKMPRHAGVLSLQGDLKISFDCDTEAVELAATNQVPNAMMEIYAASKKLAPTELDIPEKSDTANKPQPFEEVQVKAIDLGTGDSRKTTMIVSFLRADRDIFAWKPADMPGVPRRLIEHSLNVDPKGTPKRQHLRRFADERRDTIKKELTKLLTTGFIREVFHPEWLANLVCVRKNNMNSRGCASTTPISTNTAPRTPLGCRGLIKSLTPRQVVTCSACLTATPGTTKSLSRKKTRRKPRSSPRLAPTAT
jgi:hypothetical protein